MKRQKPPATVVCTSRNVELSETEKDNEERTQTKSSERYNKMLTLAQNISSYEESRYKNPVLDQYVIHPNWLEKKEKFQNQSIRNTKLGKAKA